MPLPTFQPCQCLDHDINKLTQRPTLLRLNVVTPFYQFTFLFAVHLVVLCSSFIFFFILASHFAFLSISAFSLCKASLSLRSFWYSANQSTSEERLYKNIEVFMLNRPSVYSYTRLIIHVLSFVWAWVQVGEYLQCMYMYDYVKVSIERHMWMYAQCHAPH